MIKVLVIDDSLFMRTLISDMLNSNPEIKVIDTAKDGEEAIKKLSSLKPDCITLDLAMPGWDGLTTLEHIMDEQPTPVIILSAHSRKDADITIKCLERGAVGFVVKPSGELSLDIEAIKHQLLEEVKAASQVRRSSLAARRSKKTKYASRRAYRQAGFTLHASRIVVIGASTGGPQTLEGILYSLPINFPVPVIIVQHMPSRFFTESLAGHLNKITDLEVKVAQNNEVLKPGRVYLAPSGCQLTLKSRRSSHESQDTEVVTCLKEVAHDILTPSVDITMKSAAEVYGGNAIGIILSGMGYDGREGMKAIKEAGGKTIAQDESSLIFGMPKAVIDAGYADKVLPVEAIADAMMELVSL
ncbi:MAG: chemotaxis response regulator protein-glutamate methylesterase [Candidatus Omnitrophica bacterium]|nr:chemotaxis response regulator protein-glutamate methylesterase [Candidatus Omnitrophota bacterium]MBU1524683.1 chemotaxis response regulator protein-glutamate methylesterase [Candidatus Omnitrophota bacterium]